MAAAAVVITLVLAGPMAIWMSIHSWRLRRAVRRSLGNSRALLVVGTRPNSATAETLRHAFTAEWAAVQHVSMTVVDASSSAAPDSLARAVWKRWRPNAKVPGVSGIVLVSRTGKVTRFSPPELHSSPTAASDLRSAVETALLGP